MLLMCLMQCTIVAVLTHLYREQLGVPIVNVITFYSQSCLGRGTAKGPCGFRFKQPPAHQSIDSHRLIRGIPHMEKALHWMWGRSFVAVTILFNISITICKYKLCCQTLI